MKKITFILEKSVTEIMIATGRSFIMLIAKRN